MVVADGVVWDFCAKKASFCKLLAGMILTGANERNRTADLFITSELLYRLSYIGLFVS